MLRRSLSHRQIRLTPLVMLLSGLVALVSMGAAIRAYALPTEARTTEAWYGYNSTVGFDFAAAVEAGKFYPSERVLPDQLTRVRQPVDPPQYRRVLISQFTDTINVTVPYQFQGDRDAALRANFRVDGVLSVPGVWEKPYPLVGRKEIKVDGREISGEATFSIPVGELLADLKSTRETTGIALEPLEVLVRPIFLVEAAGMREPVAVLNNPEFKLVLRTVTTEVDDPRQVRQSKSLVITTVSPITISILGSAVTVAALRQTSVLVLTVSLLAAFILIWTRMRRRKDPLHMLSKLGPNLVRAESFQLPPDAAVAVVRTAQEMVQLHHQTERPVIQVGDAAYLLDGTTCYRLMLSDSGSSEWREKNPEQQLQTVARTVEAADFTLDPWFTEVHVQSAADLLQLHRSSGRTVIHTTQGYHLMDGTVCFTYRPGPETSPGLAEAAPASVQ